MINLMRPNNSSNLAYNSLTAGRDLQVKNHFSYFVHEAILMALSDVNEIWLTIYQ